MYRRIAGPYLFLILVSSVAMAECPLNYSPSVGTIFSVPNITLCGTKHAPAQSDADPSRNGRIHRETGIFITQWS
jgi:hypothetical protein